MLRLRFANPLPGADVILSLVTLALAAPLPPTAPPPRRTVPPDLADWTPRPAVGQGEPWERATEPDWVDPRFRWTDTGPTQHATFRYPLGKGTFVPKGMAVRLPGGGGVLFDRATLQLGAGWAAGYLTHSDRRYGLMNTPTPAGPLTLAVAPGAGWASPDGTWPPPAATHTLPLPAGWVRYRGHHLTGDTVTWEYTVGSAAVYDRVESGTGGGIVRRLTVGPADKPLYLALPAGVSVWATAGECRETPVRCWVLPPSGVARQLVLGYGCPAPVGDGDVRPPAAGPGRWGEPLVTKLAKGNSPVPFAVDTLTIPYDNRHRALFFCTGVGVLPDGRVAVCTAHGDVWLVTVSESAGTCSWRRFATGLYHPLGLAVVAGKVVVLERGQLTRLHDTNADGEADFYECVGNNWHTGTGEHSYDTCLEVDPAGNYVFFKTGDTDLPHGGCLLRVSPDGSHTTVLATGFRHPIGLGMSPGGVVTGADQEGNWMPATRIDQYRQGGFYGDMRAHHRPTPPATYDGPLCWLPREVDNSAGGQVWVPKDAAGWGALAGQPLHLSYGRCKAFVLLRQELPDGRVQGGVADLGVSFLAGACRGRFAPDGSLYVCGLNGWQTAAKADGSLQRVRPTGKPFDLPVGMAVAGDTIRLTFPRPLSPAAVADLKNFQASCWNYLWRKEYGSKRWKPSDATAEGADDLPVVGADLADGGRTLVVRFDRLRPVMQMHVGYRLTAADGTPVVGSVYLTVHDTGR